MINSITGAINRFLCVTEECGPSDKTAFIPKDCDLRRYIVFFCISAAFFVLTIVLTVIFSRHRYGYKRILIPLHIFTLGIFIAVFFMYIPIHYTNMQSEFGDYYVALRPLFITIHSTMRQFVLDGEFKTILEATEWFNNKPLHVVYCSYAAVLYVLAPLLTTFNILSLFKSVWVRIRFLFIRLFLRKSDIYVFSELNERSLTTAESIYEKRTKEKKNGKFFIVYADVFEKDNNENGYDLISRAEEVKALMLKPDITRLEGWLYLHKVKKTQIKSLQLDRYESILKKCRKLKAVYSEANKEYKRITEECERIIQSDGTAGADFLSAEEINEKIERSYEDITLAEKTAGELLNKISKLTEEAKKTKETGDIANKGEKDKEDEIKHLQLVITKNIGFIKEILNDIAALNASIRRKDGGDQDEADQVKQLKNAFYALIERNVQICAERKASLKTIIKEISETSEQLKKEIAAPMLCKKHPGRLELFIIGSDEAENTEQLIKLNNLYKHCHNKYVSVYLFSTSPTAGYILDSIDKGRNTVKYTAFDKEETVSDNNDKASSTEAVRCKNMESFLCGGKGGDDLEGSYYVRRINFTSRLALKTLSIDNVAEGTDVYSTTLVKYLFLDEKPDGQMPDVPEEHMTQKKYIDLMIVGCGVQGMAFLKTALWLYQKKGYIIRITVLDIRKKSETVNYILAACPDIVIDKEYDVETDASYQINVFGNIDILHSDVYSLTERTDLTQNERKNLTDALRFVKAAFITLGDDDKNTEAAIRMRMLFDRIAIGEGRKPEPELPFVYAVVYDEKKSNNLHTGGSGKETAIKFFGGKEYDTYGIRFIGSLHDMYSYDTIEQQKSTEKEAFVYHLEWIQTASTLRSHYNDLIKTGSADAENEKFVEAFKGIAADRSWGDEWLYEADEDTGEIRVNPRKVFDEIIKYGDFEYTRNSSVAKAKHKKMLKTVFADEYAREDKKWCSCEECNNKRITEHMRWNMYMRTIGFSYNTKKDMRARYHKDIVPWDDLDRSEQYKD